MEKGPLSVISVISVLAISAQCSAQNSNSKTKKNSIVVLHYHFFRSIAMRLRPGELSKFSYMSVIATLLTNLIVSKRDSQCNGVKIEFKSVGMNKDQRTNVNISYGVSMSINIQKKKKSRRAILYSYVDTDFHAMTFFQKYKGRICPISYEFET
jgi:hypothetical protein